jgi:hypothetical protein
LGRFWSAEPLSGAFPGEPRELLVFDDVRRRRFVVRRVVVHFVVPTIATMAATSDATPMPTAVARTGGSAPGCSLVPEPDELVVGRVDLS